MPLKSDFSDFFILNEALAFIIVKNFQPMTIGGATKSGVFFHSKYIIMYVGFSSVHWVYTSADCIVCPLFVWNIKFSAFIYVSWAAICVLMFVSIHFSCSFQFCVWNLHEPTNEHIVLIRFSVLPNFNKIFTIYYN